MLLPVSRRCASSATLLSGIFLPATPSYSLVRRWRTNAVTRLSLRGSAPALSKAIRRSGFGSPTLKRGRPPFGYRFFAGETYRSTLPVKNIHCGSILSTDVSMRVRICVANCIKVTSINGKPAGPEWETGEPIYIYSNWLPVRVGSK
jgi:hypothetical protein